MDENPQEIINKLKLYTAHYIRQITKDNLSLSEIDSLMDSIANPNQQATISHDEAQKMARYLGGELGIGEHFDEKLYKTIITLARIVIELAATTDEMDSKTHGDLKDISVILYPLMTRDDRTNEIAFELKEYTDNFANLDQHDREKLGQQLLGEWYEAGEIDKSEQRFMYKKFEEGWHSNTTVNQNFSDDK